MSLNDVKEKCALCGAYLFSDDDVVYCPDCGAPHHRDCYNSIGHCALESTHGTESQYQKPQKQDEEAEVKVEADTINCGMCGEAYDKNLNNCPKCNAPNFAKVGGGRFMAFDFMGGVPAEMDLGSGVTAAEAKKFVMTNTQRYIPKFAGFNAGKKTSWNWLAFLFPCGWALSRKMYLLGSILGALQIALTMLSAPLTLALEAYDFSSAQNYMEISQLVAQTVVNDINKIGVWVVAIAAAGVIFNLLLCIITGIFGDLWYKKHAIKTICEIKQNGEDTAVKYIKSGGVNLWLGWLGIMVIEYLPSIILVFI